MVDIRENEYGRVGGIDMSNVNKTFTEGFLFGKWLEEGMDDVMSFQDYLRSLERSEVTIIYHEDNDQE